MKARVVVVAIVCAAWCAGSGGAIESAAVDVRPYRLSLILDPTIATVEWGERTIATVVARLPEDSTLSVWMAKTDAVGDTASLSYALPFDPKRKHADLEKASGLIRDEVTKQFRIRWTSARKEKTRPQSCIVTALYLTARALAEEEDARRLDGQRAKEVDADLVIVSDLLEACSDWGTPVNLERTLMSTHTVLTPEARKRISLKAFKRVTALRALHPGIDTPTAAEHLRDIWKRDLNGLGSKTTLIIDNPSSLTLSRQRPDVSDR